jgi:hypothetical protein
MSAFVPLVFMVIVFKITFGDPHTAYTASSVIN